MGPEIQALFLQIVVPVVFTSLAALIAFGGKKLIALIDAKTKNAAIAGILSRLTSAVQTTMLDINGTLKAAVSEAAADGVITPEEKRRIKEAALQRVKTHLGVKGLAEIVSVLGVAPASVDTVIGSHLEAALEATKDRSGAIDPEKSSVDPK